MIKSQQLAIASSGGWAGRINMVNVLSGLQNRVSCRFAFSALFFSPGDGAGNDVGTFDGVPS